MENWIRVRVRNGGQVIDMHAPVAIAMIEGGTAVRIDHAGREVRIDGSPKVSEAQPVAAVANVKETAMKHAPVEKAAQTNVPPRSAQPFRRVPGNRESR